MSTYRNIDPDRRLETWKDGGLVIRTDDVRDDLAFTPRPEDRPAIALDVLGEVENPSVIRGGDAIAASVMSDAEITYFAYRYLKALTIRRERASKAEAEAKEAEAQLDREALTKEGRALRRAFYGSGSADIEDNWADVARKARDLHMEAGK